MGLLDDVLGAVSGGNAANQTGSNMMAVVEGLLNNPQTGGLAGLVQSFESAGLGHIVQSWIGTGDNLSVTGSQIAQGLGGNQLGALASQFGLQQGDMANMLAQVLPQMIDRLTPNGALPQQTDIAGSLPGLLKRFLS